MTRRRIILAAVALLLAAFVMAVQRDTFVRRWCLPTPPSATRPAGPLDQVIDEFKIDDTHRMKMVHELVRRCGVRLRESDAAFIAGDAANPVKSSTPPTSYTI